MKKTGFFILFFCILQSLAFGQGQKAYGDFSKGSAKKVLKSARKQFDSGNYLEAKMRYSELLKRDSTNAIYNFELAQTLYNNFREPLSIPYYERAIKYSKDTIGEAYYFLGSAYHLAGDFDQAEKNYKKYFSLLNAYGTNMTAEEEADLKDEIKHKIEMCVNGRELIRKPVDNITIHGKSHTFQITDAGKDVNSDFDDYDAVLSANDSMMYFTSRRDSTTGGKLDWDDKYFEDIYFSRLGREGWGAISGLGEPINTDKHEAVISISADGKTIYFYKGVKQGTFYSSNRAGNSWTKPEILYEKSDLNTKAWETSFFGFTVAGSELYVVSDREGGLGGRDIYIARKQAEGNWGPLSNAGPVINTPYDEDSPFITADGKTLYFSSTGHNSMGGFDIFRSQRDADQWSAPVNMGVPVNTPGNDIYFIIASQADQAYYSSSDHSQDTTCDMDIYMIQLCDDLPATRINGLAMGLTGGTITVSEKESGKQVGAFEIKDGKYAIHLPPGKAYTMVLSTLGIENISAEIYVPKQCRQYDLYQELLFTLPGQPLVVKNAFFDIQAAAGKQTPGEYLSKANKNNLPGYNEASINTTAAMVAVKDTVKTVGKDTLQVTTLSFSSILFEYDKATLNKAFKAELDKAAAYLKDTKNKEKIEIAGYTDSRGSDAYNLSLSRKRANTILSYLASKGVKKSRMKAVGYGEANPVAPNENPDGSDNPDGRAKNRRTEIVIVH